MKTKQVAIGIGVVYALGVIAFKMKFPRETFSSALAWPLAVPVLLGSGKR